MTGSQSEQLLLKAAFPVKLARLSLLGNKFNVSNLLELKIKRGEYFCCPGIMEDPHTDVSIKCFNNKKWISKITVGCILTVRLSLSSCMISVLSLYESSFKVSSSAIASSKACSEKKRKSIVTVSRLVEILGVRSRRSG